MAPSETPASKEERSSILTMIHMLEEVRKVQADLPVSRVITLLSVALEEGKGVREYARDTDTPPSTMTRHLLDLGAIDRERQPGLGLLAARMDPLDMRRHQNFLTPAGRALIHRMLRALRLGR